MFLFLNDGSSQEKCAILPDTYPPARSAVWIVFPLHLSARSLLCWHPPAVCTAPLHKSLCGNVDILCIHKCTYLFHLYIHTSTTHTQRYHREESSGGFQILKSSSSMRFDLTESYLTRPTSCPPTTVHPSPSVPLHVTHLYTTAASLPCLFPGEVPSFSFLVGAWGGRTRHGDGWQRR